jgi:hypothetical protein
MPTLRQHLAQRDSVELRIIAQNQGLPPDDGEADDFLAALMQQMLQPEHVREVWGDLSEEARRTLAELARQESGIPAPAFQRRFGELRRIGPGRLQSEQPWKTPTGPGETLWWLGWLTRGFRKTPEGMIEYIGIPEELTPLLPLDEIALNAEPPALSPLPAPPAQRDLGELLLDDLGTILAYVQNHQVWLRSNGRWRMKDLQRLLPRLRLTRIRQQPLEAGGPLHLLFFIAKKQKLLVERKRQQRFGKALRPWLEGSRGEQMRSLFQTWREAEAWNDLCLTPGLRCQEGAWRNDPVLARNNLLARLSDLEPGQWFSLDALIALIYEHFPDFQRPDGLYDTWYIQNAAGDFLHGFEHWPAVEGRLIRYIWQGPLFWLGAVALDDAGDVWSLTPRGGAFLPEESPEEAPLSSPILRVDRDFTIVLAPHIGLWDRLRVALFSFWQASEPDYRYRITRRSLQRAARRGVSVGRILEFLQRASGDTLPANVRKALETFTP